MQNRQKALNLLGLARRAGRLISGTDIVIAGLKSKQVKVIILANDTHEDSAAKVKAAAERMRIEIITNFNAAELSQAIGQKRKVLALTDSGFSKALAKKINEGV